MECLIIRITQDNKCEKKIKTMEWKLESLIKLYYIRNSNWLIYLDRTGYKKSNKIKEMIYWELHAQIEKVKLVFTVTVFFFDVLLIVFSAENIRTKDPIWLRMNAVQK